MKARHEVFALLQTLGTLLFLFIAMTFVLGLFFSYLRAKTEHGPSSWSVRRAEEMVRALSELDPAGNSKRVFFFGSSETTVGVRARDLEQASANRYEVFNVSLLNMDADSISLLHRRLKELPIGRGGKMHTAFLSFQPNKYTARFRQTRYQSFGAYSYLVKLLSPHLLLEDFWSSPGRTVENLLTKYALNGVAPYEARRMLGYAWLGRQKRSEKFIAQLWELNGVKAWDAGTKGHFFFDYPYVDPAVLPQLRHFEKPNIKAAWLNTLRNAWDVQNLEWDDELLADFHKLLRDLQTSFDRVTVYYIPPCEQMGLTPDAKARVKEALRAIADKSGVDVLDFSDPPLFQCEDYFDMIHLNRQGQEKMTRRWRAYLSI